jgi:hypothetical protein
MDVHAKVLHNVFPKTVREFVTERLPSIAQSFAIKALLPRERLLPMTQSLDTEMQESKNANPATHRSPPTEVSESRKAGPSEMTDLATLRQDSKYEAPDTERVRPSMSEQEEGPSKLTAP